MKVTTPVLQETLTCERLVGLGCAAVDAVERVILLRRRDTAAHEARARQWRRMNIRKEFYPWPGMMSIRSVSS